MSYGKTLGLVAILGTAILAGPSAKAETVTFITTGTFDGPFGSGSNYTDADSGVVINYASSVNNTVDVPPTSQVSFGSFDTTGTTGSGTLMGTFTLTITQTSGAGAGMSVDFTADLGGLLSATSSQAFAQFSGFDTATIGNIFYQIASADDQVAGKVNMAPPSTNAGVSSITGRVGTAAVPEPASLALTMLGGTSLLAFGRRKLSRVRARMAA